MPASKGARGMDVSVMRRRRIDRIERRIARLSERAQSLYARERDAERRLTGGGRPRTVRRAERRLTSLRSERARLVQSELRLILLSLQTEASRTRERLDRELERMVPLEREWERLRSMFSGLEDTIARPGLDRLTEQWQGGLDIPDFPVSEQVGYIKPFPPKAILF